MIRTIIGASAAIIAAASAIPYLMAISRGTTQPAHATYIGKAVVGITLVTSYLASGAQATALTMLAFAMSAVATVVLSARRGVGHWTPVDRAVLAVTAVALIAWQQTGQPEVALDTSAALKWVLLAPTLVKLHARPGTENAPSWVMALTADTINLLSLPSLVAPIVLPAFNEVALSALVVLEVWRHPRPRPAPLGPSRDRSTAATSHGTGTEPGISSRQDQEGVSGV